MGPPPERYGLDQRLTDPHFGDVALDVTEDPRVGDDAFIVEDVTSSPTPDFFCVRCNFEGAPSFMSAPLVSGACLMMSQAVCVSGVRMRDPRRARSIG